MMLPAMTLISCLLPSLEGAQLWSVSHRQLGAIPPAPPVNLRVSSILTDFPNFLIFGPMRTPRQNEPATRKPRKREKTRGQLVAAGLRVLAARGEALTVSDVVAEADVSNGTFYNYFPDREALIAALAENLALDLASAAAREPVSDPALRFAIAASGLLLRATDDETWGRVVLRLAHQPATYERISHYLREDLAEGHALGRFDTGPDDATIDQVTGLLMMTIRRIVDGHARPDTALRAVERGLRALGVPREEASELAVTGLEL